MKKISFLVSLIALCGCTTNSEYYIGEQYLGKKYILNPLGEEKAPDTDPLIRFDAFDCTTFVETVLANSNKDKLTQIRYKNGEIDFINRNHFIETDWLKNNSDIVENVSDSYGITSVRTVTIDKKSWFKKMFNIDTNFKPETVKLNYIPYSNITNIRTDKPLIVLFVINNHNLKNKIGTDLAVAHMGFLLPNNMLRHASRKQGQIVDIDFNQYIIHKKKNKKNIGIILLKIK